MTRKTVFIAIALLVCSSVAGAQPGRWIEQFDSRAYIDPAGTSALVDTVASRLTLKPFRMTTGGSAATPGFAIAVALAGNHAYVAGYEGGLSVIDISDPASPIHLDGTSLFIAFDVVVSGDFAFVAADTSGLVIVDISDPGVQPVVVGSYNTAGNATGVDVDGDVVYIADADSGLVAIDVSDPAAPQELWVYAPSNVEYVAVDVEGDVVYALDGLGGLEAVDVFETGNPVQLDYLFLGGTPFRLTVEGPIAFVANESDGVQAVLVVVPWAMELWNTLPVDQGATGVASDGDVLYVSSPGYGLYAVRYDADMSFTVVDSLAIPGVSIGVVAAGEYVFVAAEAAGLQSVRIAALLPEPLAGTGVPTPVGVSGVHADGVLLYAAEGWTGLRIYDLFDASQPGLLGTYNTPGSCMGVDVAGPVAFVADQAAGLQILDVTNPEAPVFVSVYNTDGNAMMVDVSGDYAYVADHGNGLVIIDVSDVTNPVLAGTYDTPDMSTDVEVHGKHAFVADLTGGLQIVDVSNPSSPTLAGAYDRPGAFVIGLTVSGNYCYLGDDYYGLRVIDVSDPTAPTLVATVNTPGLARDVVISGDFAVVTDHNDGILVFDISTPSSPLLRGTLATSSYTRHLAVTGDYAYVSNGPDGVAVAQVFDRTMNLDDKDAQSVVLDTPGEVTHVRLTAATTDSVRFDVSADNGTSWTEVAADQQWQPLAVTGTQLMWRASLHHATVGVVSACDSLLVEYGDLVPIFVQEIRADASDGGVVLRWDLMADEAIAGFRIYRRETGGGSPEVVVNSVLLRPGVRSFADRTAAPGRRYSYSLGVVKPDGSEVRSRAVSVVTGHLQAALRQNHPNPFNPATTISYVVPRPMNVEVAVYSLEGKLVRRLVDGPAAAGAREVRWDGANERGQPVASGVYFCRYTAGKFTQTRKMLLLK